MKINWRLIILIVLTIVVLFLPRFLILDAPNQWFFQKMILGKGIKEISDTIGIMNPFAVILGAVVTYFAFSMQYEANELLKTNNEKNQKEKRADAVIAHFYVLLNLHKANVDAISWEETADYESINEEYIEDYDAQRENIIADLKSSTNMNSGDLNEKNGYQQQLEKRGKKIFEYYLIEFDLIFLILLNEHPASCIDRKFIKDAYNLFYKSEKINGEKKKIKEICNALSQNIFSLSKFMESCKKLLPNIDNELLECVVKKIFFNRNYFINKRIGEGCINVLNQYYRHLYMTTKYIANSKDVPYSQKRELLRILRTQMTNQEQTLLFYNWLSENGVQWELLNGAESAVKNSFFTDYRMIHNLHPSDLIFIKYDSIIKKKNDGKNHAMLFGNFFKENNNKTLEKKWFCDQKPESLFEFEDWFGYPKCGTSTEIVQEGYLSPCEKLDK